eukprot:TRINITY_DN38643_c0_g1_i3.p2 TRINITY_DN38643_c0_g1~~TRINITY_DN38643_c0_g1_i3.p2  ORF type:complete len:308 (-),score=10.39 TRINITY_DN38643_c0_g1_i3:331-1254(-)
MLLGKLSLYVYLILHSAAEQQFQMSEETNLISQIQTRKLMQETEKVQISMVENLFISRLFEAVVGDDDRVQVPPTAIVLPPYQTVGKLFVTCPCHSSQECEWECTATLLQNNVVVTAAHCVYNIQDCASGFSTCGEQCTTVKFFPGYPSAGESYSAKQAYHTQAFQVLLDQGASPEDLLEYDIALLEIEPVISSTTIIDFGYFGCENESGAQLYVSGYPSDLERGQQMYVAKCIIEYDTCSSTAKFYHECDTFSGMSGGPLWMGQGGHIVMRGIHSQVEYKNGSAINVGLFFSEGVNMFISDVLSRL